MRAAVLLLVIVGAPLSVRAQADLPNANLPGNSPTLPNSNLPGSLPTDNPISLPSSDTTPSVVQPWSPYVFPFGNLPVRNPTVPPTPDELVAIDEESQRRLNDAELAARTIRDSAAAREDAAAARENAAAAREDSAAVREDVAATVEQQAAPAAPPAEAPSP
jgi:hypothetical protein